ncbi:unnamed protein product [Rotaria sp. Silwood1]|nr:unnamed protein product [Rotaria sp. Silwood1]CAF3341632.1 unnamed protein product [Rotaria sp. Silwood1]CAF4699661.1 unnamed protein product [Rotaria sp. Silwood1]
MVKRSSRKRQREYMSSSDNDASHEYQVETILDKRIRGTKTEYLLKWKGYSNEDNTWEDESHLNCPALIKDFEKSLKKKDDENTSYSHHELRSKNQTISEKSKNTNMEDGNKDDENDQYKSINTENCIDSTINENNSDDDDDGDNRIVTRHNTRKKVVASSSTRRHSNRKIVKQTKFRISSMSNDQNSNDDDDINDEEEEELPSIKELEKKIIQIENTSNEKSIITIDDDDININNNSVEFPDESATNENNITEPTTAGLLLHVTPISTSSISTTHNENDNSNHNNNNNNNQTISTVNELNDQNASEIIDETDKVEKIEAVRNSQDGISFRIKLINENQSQWISSKIANQKYPQAVIAFWENYVEFT